MTTHPDLAKQIEDLVRQHVDVLRASAAAAVARAFGAAAVSARASTPIQPALRSDVGSYTLQIRHERLSKEDGMHPESLVALGWLVYLLGFLFWVFLLWLIIRQAVAAALRQQVVQQNDLILRQLAEQTKLLGSIERQLAPRAVAGGDAVDDLPPPPAARTSRP